MTEKKAIDDIEMVNGPGLEWVWMGGVNCGSVYRNNNVLIVKAE